MSSASYIPLPSLLPHPSNVPYTSHPSITHEASRSMVMKLHVVRVTARYETNMEIKCNASAHVA